MIIDEGAVALSGKRSYSKYQETQVESITMSASKWNELQEILGNNPAEVSISKESQSLLEQLKKERQKDQGQKQQLSQMIESSQEVQPSVPQVQPETDHIIKTLKLACTVAVCMMTAGLLIFNLLPDLLLGMFNPSEEFLEIGRAALRIISLSFPIAAIGISLSACFQALGNGIYSTITSLCRQMFVLLPVAYLLSLTGNVNLVWLSYPIAELASGTATVFFFIRIYRQKIKPLFD